MAAGAIKLLAMTRSSSTALPPEAVSRRRWWVLGALIVPVVYGSPPGVYLALVLSHVVDPPAWGEFWRAAAAPYGTVTAGIAALGAAGIALYNGDQQRQVESEQARKELEHAQAQLEDRRATAEREHKAGIVRDLHSRFTTATNQLAHDTSMTIQQSGAYALGALADDWLALGKEQDAQVCVSILCTYLRTHHHIAARAEGRDADTEYDSDIPPDQPVRESIQRIFADHLISYSPDGESQGGAWSELDFDFTGAHLHNWTLRSVIFESATTDFSRTRFTGRTTFAETEFAGITIFRGAEFVGLVDFSDTHFAGAADFSNAIFAGIIDFSSSIFTQSVDFIGAQFRGHAEFSNARFARSARFDRAEFSSLEQRLGGKTHFGDAEFSGVTTFVGTKFAHLSKFTGALFAGDTSFKDAEFTGITQFEGAHFAGRTRFDDPRKWGSVTVDWDGSGDVPTEVSPRDWPPIPTSPT